MRSLPVLETDFLMGLRREDKKHRLCMTILDLAKTKKIKKLAICGSAFIEIGIGLRGSLARRDIVEVLRNLRALIIPVTEIPLTSLIVMLGLELEERLSVSNLFDCLHAATALNYDAVIISDDRFYEQVPNLTRLSFKDFVKKHTLKS
ncbi:MAG: PIN domain-containing protein [Candidatus Bathyarchaeia archaeon]